eukprot:Blabericola_migrator_1__4510@NODE_2403_length_2817_cov_85_449818_g1506_i0_p3_GENE_NODE_2403_length_2817_cov_85_449818_g1506_i0NODE_2403_length_2817_cov_85_449818_g1506_i0_p3_ORF_typecomplete_len171_score22_18GrpE/PF01025_19/2e22DUF737/PF05300_11/0_2_NODE_2403_length_2817_cov_85_449818_g1506_i0151663
MWLVPWVQRAVSLRDIGTAALLRRPRLYSTTSDSQDWHAAYIQLLANRENERKHMDRILKEERGNIARKCAQSFISYHDDLRRYVEFAKPEVRDDFLELEDSLLRSLDKIGVARIDTAAGDKYDPKFHEAIAHIDTPSQEGTLVVAQVVTSGFVMDSSVIRPSRVVTTRQ